MKKLLRPILAAVCFALALFFAFALIGYIFTAALFAGIGCVLLLWEWLSRKNRHGAKKVLAALLCVGVLALIIVEIPIVRSSRGDEDFDADYIIVLGAGVNGSTPSLSMVNRLTAALDYLHSHPDCLAVVSGGQGGGEDISEAEAMRRWLSTHGIADGRILIEDKATSTEENLRYSFELIGGQARVAVVSSEYHLCRAKAMARLLGREVGGIAGRTTYPVLKFNYFFREAFAMVYLWVFGI